MQGEHGAPYGRRLPRGAGKTSLNYSHASFIPVFTMRRPPDRIRNYGLGTLKIIAWEVLARSSKLQVPEAPTRHPRPTDSLHY